MTVLSEVVTTRDRAVCFQGTYLQGWNLKNMNVKADFNLCYMIDKEHYKCS